MIDATYLNAYRTAASFHKNGGSPPISWVHERWSGLETARGLRRKRLPDELLLSERQMSDDTGDRRLLPSLQNSTYMIATGSYDVD